MARPSRGPCLQAVAAPAGQYDRDPRVREMVQRAAGELRLWGEECPQDLDAASPGGVPPERAARAFKAQALAALPAAPLAGGQATEVFRRAQVRGPLLVPAG